MSLRRSMLTLLTLVTLACSPRYQLLETAEESDAAGGAPSGAASTAGGPVGGASLSDPGGTNTGGLDSGGSASAGGPVGGGGAATGGAGAAIGESCARHGDCAFGTQCSGYQCTACADAPDRCTNGCAHGFQQVQVTRNGCSICECAPPSECTSSADCESGEVCHAGAHCADGCSDPSCCHGNQCSPASCGAAPPMCLEFGCTGGDECLASCDSTSCECDGASWRCESTTGGAAVASCPQACAPT